jgi:hypothetical protein
MKRLTTLIKDEVSGAADDFARKATEIGREAFNSMNFGRQSPACRCHAVVQRNLL